MKTLVSSRLSNLKTTTTLSFAHAVDQQHVRQVFAVRHLERRYGLRPSAARIVAEWLGYDTEASR